MQRNESDRRKEITLFRKCKDELPLLTKSDQFYSKIKSAVLPETIGVTAL